ncbi:hypothetical protein BLOT_008920 [Blomia tropicalis]|nr:hypothetical protein BLOT_008920 [Blomia tropicalis]
MQIGLVIILSATAFTIYGIPVLIAYVRCTNERVRPHYFVATNVGQVPIRFTNMVPRIGGELFKIWVTICYHQLLGS